MQEKFDVLANLDILEMEIASWEDVQKVQKESIIQEKDEEEKELANISFQEEEILEGESIQIENNLLEEEEKEVTKKKKLFSGIIFLGKYITTSTFIFFILLAGSNYSAYSQLIGAYFWAEEMEQNKHSMIESVSAAEKVEKEVVEKENISLTSLVYGEEKKGLSFEEEHSLSRLKAQAAKETIKLDITITPYENRIVIPKIGKNIPLVEVSEKKVDSLTALNDIFMKELENGVVRYPGSALPWQAGNSFIFGHSSNFPWFDGKYNDVFALLDKVVYGDEIIVYYGQKKYVYKILEKEVVRPGDTSLLKKQDQSRKTITLMTCWPIWTTLNRLMLIWYLVEE